jgi:hypothetical protein
MQYKSIIIMIIIKSIEFSSVCNRSSPTTGAQQAEGAIMRSRKEESKGWRQNERKKEGREKKGKVIPRQ